MRGSHKITNKPLNQLQSLGITLLSGFFAITACISLLSGISLLTAGGLLEPMWQINPQAHKAFIQMGTWAIILLASVCIACTFSAIGLWQRTRWGYKLAIAVFIINLIGDFVNLVLGDIRSVIGIPVAVGLIIYLLGC